MTKHKITLEIDTDNLDLAVSELESSCYDMIYNQIDELTEKPIINNYEIMEINKIEN